MGFLEINAFDGEIKYLQIMDEKGNIDPALYPKDLDDTKILSMYNYMLLARMFDAKVLSLQRQGRAVTYAPLVGEEATQIGTAFALRKEDIFVPSFRQHGSYIVRGFPMESMFLYWRGYEEGASVQGDKGDLPVAVPVATQVLHGAGMAFAQKYKKTGNVALVYVGDGGTSEGEFYEALNFAGVMKLPLIVIIENNQWAISIPRAKQSAAKTLAQKAIAAGIRGVQVDGNDVVAVYKATKEAIDSAADGPTVIECVTYRMSMHTTADDPTKYRSDSEVEQWKPKDPIARVKTYLEGKGLWNDELESKATAEFSKQIDEAVEKAEKFVENPESMFDNIYSFMPDTLKDELEDAKANGFWQGDK